MEKRDELIQGLAVGLGAGAAGAAGVCLIKFGASQEAVLSLLGALIGAAATVAGAAWLSDRNARVEEAAERELLTEELRLIRDQAASALALAPVGNAFWSDEYRAALHGLDPPIREIHSICLEALSHGRRLTFRQRTRLRQVEAASEQTWQFYADCFRSEEELHPLDERNWPQALGELIGVTDKALADLRR